MADTTGLRDVELPADLILDDPKGAELVQHYALTVAHARDLLPPDQSRYLAEAGEAVLEPIVQACCKRLTRCAELGISYATLELGLDRICQQDPEPDLAARVALVRRLVAAVDGLDLTLCIPVRYPRPYPGSHDWEMAGNLVHEVMHPACRLTLDLFPAEFEEGLDVREFIRSFYFNAAVLRFHYEPAVGEHPQDWFPDWPHILRDYGFRGPIVFCPRLTVADGASEVCHELDAFLAEQHDAIKRH